MVVATSASGRTAWESKHEHFPVPKKPGPRNCISGRRLRRHREWPAGEGVGLARLPRDGAQWPIVEIVTSHSEAQGTFIGALRDAGVHGIVVACTGNGSVHHALHSALLEAQAAGIGVLRATRWLGGSVIDPEQPELPSAGALTPVQARIELVLQLLARRAA